MKNSKLYFTLPTIRKVRRQLRRVCGKTTAGYGCKATFILRDNDGENILKVRRWRNRIMTTKRLV